MIRKYQNAAGGGIKANSTKDTHRSKNIIWLIDERVKRKPKNMPTYDPNYKGGGTKIIEWIRDNHWIEGAIEGLKQLLNPRWNGYDNERGGRYGGGGAGGKKKKKKEESNKKTDKYNIREERKIIVNNQPVQRKPIQRKPTVVRPFPDQELPEVVVIANRPSYTADFAPKEPVEETIPQIHVPVNHYNRRTTRELIRAKGLNPYHMGSLQRKQLRKYLNGELSEDQVSPTVLSIAQRAIVPDNQVWNNYYPDNQPREGIVSDVREFFRPD